MKPEDLEAAGTQIGEELAEQRMDLDKDAGGHGSYPRGGGGGGGGGGHERPPMSREESDRRKEVAAEDDQQREDHAAAAAGGVRSFGSSSDAYDACQTGDVKDGDTLHVPSEGVVGLGWTWPLAVTAKNGELHTVNAKPGAVQRLVEGKIAPEQVRAAVSLAKERGYPVNPMFDDYLEDLDYQQSVEDDQAAEAPGWVGDAVKGKGAFSGPSQ